MFLAMDWALASAALYHPSSSDFCAGLGAAGGAVEEGGGLEKAAEGGGDVACPEVDRTGDSASALTSTFCLLAAEDACSRCRS